jgi:hypothetical protein
MGKYSIEIKETAQNEIKLIQKSGDKATIKKIESFIKSLKTKSLSS